MRRDARDSDRDSERGDSATSEDANTDAWGQKGTPGMIGSGGNVANLDVGRPAAAPIGVPETPGTAASPGTGVNPGDMGVSSTGRTNPVLGTPANAGSANQGNLEPGTPDVPGAPAPTSLGADTPDASDPPPSGGDLNAGSSYGRSGTPGLGGAGPTEGGDPRLGGDLDQSGNPVDSGDALSQRSTGSANDNAGTGISGLGGSQGGTQNYGGVGVPGGARTLGSGRADDAARQTTATDGLPSTGGLSASPNAARGQGAVAGSTVLPGGATRPHELDDGQKGEIQMKDGDEYQTRTSGQGDPAYPPPDALRGTGAGAAANDVAEGGAEAATIGRHGDSRPTIAGSPAPMSAPPAPDTDNPYGGSQSESAANPLQEGEIPTQPTPGVIREPGPQAEH